MNIKLILLLIELHKGNISDHEIRLQFPEFYKTIVEETVHMDEHSSLANRMNYLMSLDPGTTDDYWEYIRKEEDKPDEEVVELDKNSDEYNFVKCEICDRKLSQLTVHINRTHHITVDEYKSRFPGKKTISPNTSAKLSSSNSGKVRSPEHSKNLRASIIKGFENGRQAHNKGIKGVVKQSNETRRKQSKIRTGKKVNRKKSTTPRAAPDPEKAKQIRIQANKTRKFNRNNVYGPPPPPLKHTEETKKHLSEVAKNRTPAQVAVHVKNMNEARRGQKESAEVRLKRSAVRIKYMAENPDKLPKRMFDTVPELEFEEELKKRGIPYRKQYHTAKPHFLYDFIINECILVEIDGPYHYNPELYSTIEEYKTKQDIDMLKTDAAEAFGMLLLRIKVGQHLPENWEEILEEQDFFIDHYDQYTLQEPDEEYKKSILDLYKEIFEKKRKRGEDGDEDLCIA